MPVVYHSSYKPPFLIWNPHAQTIYSSVFRRVGGVRYERERIDTPDGDFIDLDWSRTDSNRAVIVLHGLESCSQASYMRGMVRAFNRRGWDAAAYNFRGRSGEPNRLYRSYHSGATDDLEAVVSHVIRLGCYDQLALVGFSLGGNVTLKYLGEKGANVSEVIRTAAAVSVPCDLESCSWKLAQRSNFIYMKRFLIFLGRKMKQKKHLLPDGLTLDDFRKAKNFKDFDNLYTAPAHGFADAEEYWSKCSSRQFISSIAIPTLLISARDDPFLTEKCFPFEEAKASEHFHLEVPEVGGHVGFVSFNSGGEYWHESRAVEFVESV